MPKIKTGSWATEKPERRHLTPPCNHVCPAGNDVRGFVEAVGQKDYDRALSVLLETSPLPAVCGRVCPAPCMDTCNRAEFDQSVNVREIERAAAELGTRPQAEPLIPERGGCRGRFRTCRSQYRLPVGALGLPGDNCMRPVMNWAVYCAPVSRPIACRGTFWMRKSTTYLAMT